MSSAKKQGLRPTDPDVKVPNAVRAAAERATQLHQEVYKPAEGDAPQDPPVADPNAQTPPATPDPAPTPPAPANEDWEAKYNHMLTSMKGRVEREQQISRNLSERIASLEQTIATISAPPAPPADSTKKSGITEQEIAEYGPEFLDLVRRQAEAVVSQEVVDLRNQVAQLQQQLGNVGQHVQKDARTRMHDKLTEAVPNWLEINKSEKFLDWLALPDPYSGLSKHELLKSAYAANDTPRVLNFFKGFLAAEAATLPPPPEPGLPAPAADPKVPLETLAAPGRAKTAAPSPAPVEKPLITRAEVTQFYADKARGLYRGREEEATRLESMIFEANREGRIR